MKPFNQLKSKESFVEYHKCTKQYINVFLRHCTFGTPGILRASQRFLFYQYLFMCYVKTPPPSPLPSPLPPPLPAQWPLWPPSPTTRTRIDLAGILHGYVIMSMLVYVCLHVCVYVFVCDFHSSHIPFIRISAYATTMRPTNQQTNERMNRLSVRWPDCPIVCAGERGGGQRLEVTSNELHS